MSQFQSQMNDPDEIDETEFKVLSRQNVKRIHTNDKVEKEDKLYTYLDIPSDQKVTNHGLVEEAGPINPALKVRPPMKTDPMLLNCEFIGSIDPFTILIQFEDRLIKMNGFNLLVSYMEYLTGNLIESDSEEHEFNVCTIASAVYDPAAISKQFNTSSHDGVIFERTCNWLSDSPTKLNQYLNFNSVKNEVTFPMLEILRPFLSKRAINYLLFLFANNQSKDELFFFQNTVVKINVFLMVEALKKILGHEDRWFKKEMDFFYKMLFYKLKKKEFSYAFQPTDEVQIILNIKDVYKLFERC